MTLSQEALWLLIAADGVAALLMAFLFQAVIAKRYPQKRASTWWYVFVLCFFLPVGGQLLFLSLLAFSIFHTPDKLARSNCVNSPHFDSQLIARVTHNSGARIRAKLEDPNEPEESRIVAMTALFLLPTHITDGMLRKLLMDSNEEIRLLAYGIMDKTEKKITEQILQAKDALDDAVTAFDKERLNDRLAQLYWELIYQKIVTGDMYDYTLERVQYYANEALAANANNATMWYLLGRCALLHQDIAQAERFLLQAKHHLFPEERLLPWFAEIAFSKRNYHEVRKLLFSFKKNNTPFLLQPSVRYWSK